MINGLTQSEIFLRSKLHQQHYNRLRTITTSKSKLFQPCKELVKHQKQSKKRHASARSFLKSQQKRQVKTENKKLVMSLIRIATRYNEAAPRGLLKRQESQKKVICSEEINRKRREKQIIQENKRMVKNIIHQKTAYPNIQNQKSFAESRQIVDRINKFPLFKRVSRSSTKLHKKSMVMQPVDLGESLLFDSSWKLKTTESQIENPENIKNNVLIISDSKFPNKKSSKLKLKTEQ